MLDDGHVLKQPARDSVEIVQKQDGEGVAGTRQVPLTPSLERCQKIIGYEFRDIGILLSALNISVFASTRTQSNERMNFLVIPY